MKKLMLIGALGLGLVAFVGTDVVSSAVKNARENVREALTADVPLETRLAEARARIDRYAEHIIQGEVAAEALADRIEDTEREVRGLTVRTTREREHLVALRDQVSPMGEDSTVVPTALTAEATADPQVLRRVESYRSHSALLARRQDDLTRMTAQYEQTLDALETARTERTRLAEEARALESEIQSLAARKAAAQTRAAVGEASFGKNGFAEADKALESIRGELRKQDKLLDYYELRHEAAADTRLRRASPQDALTAIDEALATWPGQDR